MDAGYIGIHCPITGVGLYLVCPVYRLCDCIYTGMRAPVAIRPCREQIGQKGLGDVILQYGSWRECAIDIDY